MNNLEYKRKKNLLLKFIFNQVSDANKYKYLSLFSDFKLIQVYFLKINSSLFIGQNAKNKL